MLTRLHEWFRAAVPKVLEDPKNLFTLALYMITAMRAIRGYDLRERQTLVYTRPFSRGIRRVSERFTQDKTHPIVSFLIKQGKKILLNFIIRQ